MKILIAFALLFSTPLYAEDVVSSHYICTHKDNNGNVTGLKTINVEFKNGKLNEIDGTEKTWDTQLVLLSMGFISPEHYLSEDAKIDLDDRGNYKAEYGAYSTSKSGIFTAGDCRRGQSLVVWAINEGRGVAKSVNTYLS